MTERTLIEELARKAREVEVLRHASLEINTTLDLEEIFDIVLRTMDELFKFHHSIILLPEDDGNVLRVVASRGYEGQALGGTVAVGTGVIGTVAKRHKLMRIGNLGQRRTYVATIREQMQNAGRESELDDIVPLPGLPSADSQLAIPLLIRDTLVGVLSVESPEHRPFSEHDELLVTIVANQAASAIQNAQLYAAALQRREELAEAHERVKQLNETLEDRVRERTRELGQANRDLQETQTQLVQSEKMAMLGMLSAGVAHEINTPVGVIHANTSMANQAIKIIHDAVENRVFDESLAEQAKLNDAFKVLEETNSLMQEATERVATIVRSLKSFARLDQAQLETVDLREGIDSALTLLHHLLEDRIQVMKNYGAMPKVRCGASLINQVFMSLLTNAVQAIQGNGNITITTRGDEGYAVVEIADTGRGIPNEDLKHIFDPRFTTKGSRVGIGLGLSMAYRIIDDHHGSIEVQSELGRGTTFLIKLPAVS